MKIQDTIPCLPALAAASAIWISQVQAATIVWDGGGDGIDLGQAANWAGDILPANSDVLQWNGSVAGALSLEYSTIHASGFNSNPGISISLTSDQTGPLTINGQSNALRLNSSGISIANGAGAFSLGNGSGTTNITSFNGTMAMTNNSSNAATIAADVVFATTFAGTTTFQFAGSGNWDINTNLRSTNNSGGNVVSATGTGTVFMNSANTYTGNTNIGSNGGSARVRATVTGALGSGQVFIAGNGGSNRLELVGGITLNNAISSNGKENAVGAAAAILNVSGDNTLGATVTFNVGGSDNTIRSDSGLLTLSAATAITHSATGTRRVLFTGDGDITVSGNIAQGGSTLGIQKQGEGRLILGGANNTYTGATTVTAGTLLINGSLANTAVNVSSGATIGGTGTLGGSLSLDASATLTVVDINDPLAVAGTVTFGSGFGIANLAGIAWDSLDMFTSYSILSTSQVFSESDIANFGVANATAVGSMGRLAYFDNGSLAVVVIPEPSAALLGGLGLLALLRRRRG